MSEQPPVVLVTGASSGIGRAIASEFASRRFEVFGTSRDPRRTDPITGVTMLPLDVGDDASVSAAVSTVIEQAGRIDVVVNNAGVGVFGAAEESSIEQAKELFETNFFGLIRVTTAVLPHLRAQRSGRIINVGSVLGFIAAPYGALYSASKHAVEGYSESLDHETREFGVRVSVVEPGYTDTSFDANAAEPDSPIDDFTARRERVKEALITSVRAGDDPAVVARVVVKAATSRAPKLRYPAGALARQLTVLKKFAPTALLDKGIRKANKLDAVPRRAPIPQSVR